MQLCFAALAEWFQRRRGKIKALTGWISHGLLLTEIFCGPYAALENEKKKSGFEATDTPLDGLYFFAVRGPLCWHEVLEYINKTRILERRESFSLLVSSAGQALVTSRGCGHMLVALDDINFWSKAGFLSHPPGPANDNCGGGHLLWRFSSCRDERYHFYALQLLTVSLSTFCYPSEIRLSAATKYQLTDISAPNYWSMFPFFTWTTGSQLGVILQTPSPLIWRSLETFWVMTTWGSATGI